MSLSDFFNGQWCRDTASRIIWNHQIEFPRPRVTNSLGAARSTGLNCASQFSILTCSISNFRERTMAEWEPNKVWVVANGVTKPLPNDFPVFAKNAVLGVGPSITGRYLMSKNGVDAGIQSTNAMSSL